MAKDKGLYSQSLGECTWQAVSDDHYFKFFILCSVAITIEKVHGTVFGYLVNLKIAFFCVYFDTVLFHWPCDAKKLNNDHLNMLDAC